MTRPAAIAALFAASALLAACGGGADDGSPTAAENDQLNQAAAEVEDLDASPDSLVADEAALGNGEEPAAAGDLPVVSNEVANGQ